MIKMSSYSIISNMKYFINELWLFKPSGVIISFMGIPVKVLQSITAIFVPMLVLDAVARPDSILDFFRTIVGITLLLAVVSFLDLFSRNTMQHCTNAFIYTHMNCKWIKKTTDMDYEAFTSEMGKQKAEKARVSLDGASRWGLGAYFPNLVLLLTNALGFISFSVIIIDLHILILPLLVACYMINLYITLHVEKQRQQTKDDLAKSSRKLNYVAYRTRELNIGKDIRIFSMVGLLHHMANQAKNDRMNIQKKLANHRFMLNMFNVILTFLRDGITYAYLIYSVLHESITIGEFVLYFGAIAGLGEWLSKFISHIGDFTTSNNYVTDFRSFMDIPDKMNKQRQTKPLKTGESVSIQLDSVSFAYAPDKNNVLEDINMHIKSGEKLAIVGENGAGKTTIVKLIAGLIQPSKGRVLLNGIPISQFSRDEYYSIFSAIFQDSGVLPISIADNIALNVDAEKDIGRIKKCIEWAGLTDKVGSLPLGLETNLVKQITEEGTEFSGGEIQRLLLARALYKKASVIILDEPTAALDPIAENEVYLRYNQFIQEKTAIFISHRLASTRFCDRIILIYNKKITEMGTHDELMKLKGKYAELFDIQSQYYKNATEV